MAEPTRRDVAAVLRGRGGTKPVRHGRQARIRTAPTLIRVVAIGLAVVLVASVSLATFVGWTIGNKVTANSFELAGDESVPTISVGEIQGGFNLLVVGADNSPTQGNAYGARGGTLNDVNILLHVAADHESATVVSIPRDLVIPHPTCTNPATGATYAAMSAQPLNVAMSRGGISCVVTTIESLTGLKIPYAALFTFKAVVKMTDAIGGVTVCLANPINDPKADLDLAAGMQTISGKDALGFLRTRHGVGDGSDLSRISVQQIYMSALVRQIKSADTLTNPAKLYGLADAAASNVQLSSSLASLDTMVAMAKTLRTIDLGKLTFIQYPGTTGDPRYPGKVVPIASAADKLFSAIKSDTPIKAAAIGRASVESTPTPTPTGSVTPPATPTPTPSSTPSAAPTASGAPTPVATSETIAGTVGQSADQTTCARGFLK